MHSYRNLSNFEARIKEYINNSDNSRNDKNTVKPYVRKFIQFLRLHLSNNSQKDYSQYLSAHLLNKYTKWLESRNYDTKKISKIKLILKNFRSHWNYLSTIQNTLPDHLKNPLNHEGFLLFLEKHNASTSTLRNYRSDLVQFIAYLKDHYQQKFILEDITKNPLIQNDYIQYLTNTQKLNPSTIKRKLSAINSYISWHNKNQNKPKEIRKYSIQGSNIERENTFVGKSTGSLLARMTFLFHYRSIQIGTFLIILVCLGATLMFFPGNKTRKETVSLPSVKGVNSNRTILYNGRILDKSGIPLAGLQQIQFKLWDKEEGGTLLYDSKVCTIVPDRNSIFSITIGSKCGSPIAQTIFLDYPAVFLALSVNGETEMKPRQHIANVEYSTHSEFVQGLKPSSPATYRSIPFIDNNGSITIAAVSPILKSLAGKFIIEGQLLSFRTNPGSNGSISLSPDGSGTVNMLFSGTNPGTGKGFLDIANHNITNGSLINVRGSGLQSGYNLLQLSSGLSPEVKFSVDAQGNVFTSGNLKVGDYLEASSSQFTSNAPIYSPQLLLDAGLGFYSTRGTPIPTTFDFTKGTSIEFDFKAPASAMDIKANLSTDGLKYYLLRWDIDNTMNIYTCTPTCQKRASQSKLWEGGSWHHAAIVFTKDSISWTIDKSSSRLQTSLSSDVPLLSNGSIQFTSGSLLTSLRVSASAKTLLALQDAWIGGSLEASGSATISGQLTLGSFSSSPKANGKGSLYYNSLDNNVYFWNGSTWIRFEEDGGTSPSFTNELTVTDNEPGFIGAFTNQGNADTRKGIAIQACLDANPGPSCNFLELRDGNGTVLGAIEGNGAGGITNASSGSDYAELFPGDRSALSDGDIIGLDRNGHAVPATPATLLIGGLSRSPATLGNWHEAWEKDTALVPVGLLGQLPIKVSQQNGPIQKGDPIGISPNQPGIGIKAVSPGRVLGFALEDTILTPTAETRTVRVFVSPTWHGPSGHELYQNWHSELSIARRELDHLINTSKNVVAESFQDITGYVENLTVKDLVITNKLTSPIIESNTIRTDQITTSLISPLASELTISLVPSGQQSTEPASLRIENRHEETVASIDEEGNATFEGTLTSRSLQTTEATVEGALYAGSIESKTITNLKDSFGELLAKVDMIERESTASTVQAQVATTEASHSALTYEQLFLSPTPSTSLPTPSVPPPLQESESSASAQASMLPYSDEHQTQILSEADTASQSSELVERVYGALTSSMTPQELETYLSSLSDRLAVKSEHPIPAVTLSQDIQLPENLRLGSLHVIESTTLGDTAVAGQLLVDGTILLENNKIASITDSLSLTAGNLVDIMSGSVVIDKMGNLTSRGTLIAKQGIRTNQIRSDMGNLSIYLSGTNQIREKESVDPSPAPQETESTLSNRIGGFGLLIHGANDQQVGSIDSYGNAQFAGSLTAGKLNLINSDASSSTTLSPAQTHKQYGINAPALVTNASAGIAMIPQGEQELYIFNKTVTKDSLLYLTNTSNTQNTTLYIKDKKPGEYFVVALEGTILYPVTFNWMVVN